MGLLTVFIGLKILPRVMRSIGYLILIALSFNYIFQSDEVLSKERNEFCTYTYKVDSDTIPICSTEELLEWQVDTIETRLVKSLELYREFSNRYGKVKYTIPLTIYVMDVETLNDQSIFGSKFTKRVVGRYTERLGHVYITMEAFESVGYTDLQHEIAHYGNDNLGLSGDELDEELAAKFEQYYKRHVYK